MRPPDFIAVVPARLKSTRLPGKPLADICGLPMVVRVAQQALQSGATRVIVAADDASIVDVCTSHGLTAMLTSAAHTTGTDRLAEVVNTLALPDQTVVVNVQGDEPLVPPQLIAQVAQTLIADPDCSIATCAHPITSPEEICNPNVVKVVCDAKSRAMLFSRAPIPWGRDTYPLDKPLAADAPPILRHIGLYAYRAGFLRQFPALQSPPLEHFEALEQLRALWHGYSIAVRVIDSAPPGGVDTQADLERVRAVLAGR